MKTTFILHENPQTQPILLLSSSSLYNIFFAIKGSENVVFIWGNNMGWFITQYCVLWNEYFDAMFFHLFSISFLQLHQYCLQLKLSLVYINPLISLANCLIVIPTTYLDNISVVFTFKMITFINLAIEWCLEFQPKYTKTLRNF